MYLRSSDFVSPIETLDPDAFIDPHDLVQLKRLAGIPVVEDVSTMMGLQDSHQANPIAPAANNSWGIKSPIGTTGSNFDKHKIEKAKNITPGTDEWFRLWFSKDAKLTADDFEEQEYMPKGNSLFSKQPNAITNESARDPLDVVKTLAGLRAQHPK